MNPERQFLLPADRALCQWLQKLYVSLVKKKKKPYFFSLEKLIMMPADKELKHTLDTFTSAARLLPKGEP